MRPSSTPTASAREFRASIVKTVDGSSTVPGTAKSSHEWDRAEFGARSLMGRCSNPDLRREIDALHRRGARKGMTSFAGGLPPPGNRVAPGAPHGYSSQDQEEPMAEPEPVVTEV